jgi:hypothetical protein
MSIVHLAKASAASLLLGTLSLGAAEKVIVSHDYNDAKAWEANSVDALKKAGWKPNSTADRDHYFCVKPINNTNLQWLYMWDDNPAGAPLATLAFAGLKHGRLTAAMATAGKEDQGVVLTLTSRGRPLLRIVLTNNTTGYLETGCGKMELAPPEGKTFYCSPAEFTVTWSTDETAKPAKPATVTVLFAGKEIISGKAMMALGAVDNVSISASWHNSVGKGLYLSKLTVVSTK